MLKYVSAAHWERKHIDIEQAAAHVLSILSTRGEELIPKSPVNTSMITSRGLIGIEPIWIAPEEGERHLSTCGHEV
jgi:hypothetical protein